jgi:nucleoid DNA-binding protein
MTNSEVIILFMKVINQKCLTRAVAKDFIARVFDEIATALEEDERVELREFGVFERRYYKPRKARNPRTNKVIYLQERSRPFFIPSRMGMTKLNIKMMGESHQ